MYEDVRTRVRAGRYLLPDAAVVAGAKIEGLVLTEPPLIWIEVLSPEDRPIRLNRKIQCEVHTPQVASSPEDGVLRVAGTPIEVPLQALEED